MNRRSLFRALSSVALAPLVKLVPKEPGLPTGYVIGCDLAGPEPSYTVWRYENPAVVQERFNRLTNSLFAKMKAEGSLPVPQEEA